MVNDDLRDFFYENHDIKVGLYSYGCFDRWRMPGPLRIGRYCSFANSVRIVEANHPMNRLTTHPIGYDPALRVIDTSPISADPLIIEDDVWVGHGVTILPTCKFIGRGAVIGAGSVVTRNVAPYTIVAGNPARYLRDRFEPDLVAKLERSHWWEFSIEELAKQEKDRKVVSNPSGLERFPQRLNR